VTIQVPTDAVLRGTAALRQLVEAVVAADEHDEADWIEWKGTLDLTAKEGCFHVARAVLGLANRLPERAAPTCEGLGYVIVGAEPGTLHGLATVDPARLDQVIEHYLGGADGPAFTPAYVAIDGKTVLVVTIEAPMPGDPIRTLRRQLDKYLDGTIFVRKHGRTVIADAADIDALQRRLTDGPARTRPDLTVSVVGDVPLSWFDPAAVRPLIDAWTAGRAEKLMEAARETERRRQAARAKPSTGPAAAGTLPALAALAETQAAIQRMAMASVAWGSSPDRRTLDEYESEVDEWRGELVEVATRGFPGRYTRAGRGVVRVQVENLGSRFLPDVEVEVRFEGDIVRGFHKEPEWIDYPARPREFGKAQPTHDLASLLGGSMVQPYIPDLGGIRRNTWVEDGSLKVRWTVGDLRQHGKDTSDEVYVFLFARPEDGMLHGTWRATLRDLDGVLDGTVEVPVGEEPVDPRTVLAYQRPRN